MHHCCLLFRKSRDFSGPRPWGIANRTKSQFGSEQKRPGANRPPEFVPESPLQKGLSLGVILSSKELSGKAHTQNLQILREDTLRATCSAGPYPCLLPSRNRCDFGALKVLRASAGFRGVLRGSHGIFPRAVTLCLSTLRNKHGWEGAQSPAIEIMSVSRSYWHAAILFMSRGTCSDSIAKVMGCACVELSTKGEEIAPFWGSGTTLLKSIARYGVSQR